MECHQCYVWICVFTAILFPLVLIGFSTEIIEEAEEPIEHDGISITFQCWFLD